MIPYYSVYTICCVIQKSTPKPWFVTTHPATLATIDEEDLDEDNIEAPTFSPISVDCNEDISDNGYHMGIPDRTDIVILRQLMTW